MTSSHVSWTDSKNKITAEIILREDSPVCQLHPTYGSSRGCHRPLCNRRWQGTTGGSSGNVQSESLGMVPKTVLLLSLLRLAPHSWLNIPRRRHSLP